MTSEPQFLTQLSVDDLRNLRRAVRTAEFIDRRVAEFCRTGLPVTDEVPAFAEVSWPDAEDGEYQWSVRHPPCSVTLRSADGSEIAPREAQVADSDDGAWRLSWWDSNILTDWGRKGFRPGAVRIDIRQQSWGRPDPRCTVFFTTRLAEGSWLSKMIRKPQARPQRPTEVADPASSRSQRGVMGRILSALGLGRRPSDPVLKSVAPVEEEPAWWEDGRAAGWDCDGDFEYPEELAWGRDRILEGGILFDQSVPAGVQLPRVELEADPSLEMAGLEEALRLSIALDFAREIDGIWQMLKEHTPAAVLTQAIFADIAWHTEYDDNDYIPIPVPTFRRMDGTIVQTDQTDQTHQTSGSSQPTYELEEEFRSQCYLHHNLRFTLFTALPPVRLNLATGDWGGPDWEKFRIYGANLACFPWSPPMP